MKIPGGDKAVVDIRKLLDYCLSETHFRGKHKAKVFASALGITSEHAFLLRQSLLDAARMGDALATEEDQYGQRYMIDWLATHAAKQATVRSIWIVRKSEEFPRLLTCYVL